jgi:ribosomal protein S18 acetylase RimI-like enzyme
MLNLSYSQISDSDQGFLHGLYRSLREPELSLVPWSEEQKAAFVASQFAAQHQHYLSAYPNGLFQIIKMDDLCVGRFYVSQSEDQIRIIDLTILPEFRGRGIGTQILSETLESAGKRVTIYLESFSESVGLFERLGFRIVKDEGIYVLWERPVLELSRISNATSS